MGCEKCFVPKACMLGNVRTMHTGDSRHRGHWSHPTSPQLRQPLKSIEESITHSNLSNVCFAKTFTFVLSVSSCIATLLEGSSMGSQSRVGTTKIASDKAAGWQHCSGRDSKSDLGQSSSLATLLKGNNLGSQCRVGTAKMALDKAAGWQHCSKESI